MSKKFPDSSLELISEVDPAGDPIAEISFGPVSESELNSELDEGEKKLLDYAGFKLETKYDTDTLFLVIREQSY